MGATKSETIRRVLFPAALPGIVAGIMLAVSRAIGETMIVVMAASPAANLTANPLEPNVDRDGADCQAADRRTEHRSSARRSAPLPWASCCSW